MNIYDPFFSVLQIPTVQGPAWAGDAGWPKRPSYRNHKREAQRRRNREMNRRRHTWA